MRGPGSGCCFSTAISTSRSGRFTETRRRHPLVEAGAPEQGIRQEKTLLEPLRQHAETAIDTSLLTGRDLRREVQDRFGRPAQEPARRHDRESFSFAKGAPRGADLVFDVRFLANPHYDAALRPMTGLDAPVAEFVAADPAFDPFMARLGDLLLFLLPLYEREGKSYLTAAIGCTGGRHRSVRGGRNARRRLAGPGLAGTRDPPRSRTEVAIDRPGRRGVIGVVIVSHGALASELLRAAEHVVGEMAQAEPVAIGPDDDPAERRQDIFDAVSRVDSGDGVVVLTDMFGGTPSNLAISNHGRRKCRSDRRRQPADAGQACGNPRPGEPARLRHRGRRGRPEVHPRRKQRARRRGVTGLRDMTEEASDRRVIVCNPKGLHARPASKVAKLAQRFDAAVSIHCNGETAEADSIMDLLMLGAAPGAELSIEAYGRGSGGRRGRDCRPHRPRL